VKVLLTFQSSWAKGRVVPAVAHDVGAAGQGPVDGGHVRDVVHEALEGGVDQPAADGGVEEALDSSLRTSTRLQAVVALEVREAVLDLPGVVVAELGQVHRETDRAPGGSGVEADQAQLVDLEGGDLFGEASDALVLVSRREKEKRASLTMLLESVLVSQAARSAAWRRSGW